MIVEKRNENGGAVYVVCADARETGTRRQADIITLDTLERAALVLRYLRGDRMTPGDQDDAKRIIREFDRQKGQKGMP